MHLINTTKHLLCVKYKENEVISFLGKHKNCDNLTIFCSLDDIQIQGVLWKRNKLHCHSIHVSLVTVLHEKQAKQCFRAYTNIIVPIGKKLKF